MTPELTKTELIERHAARYRVTPRTISRWIARGIDPSNLVQVSDYLLSIKGPSVAALFAVRDLLANELLTSTIKH